MKSESGADRQSVHCRKRSSSLRRRGRCPHRPTVMRQFISGPLGTAAPTHHGE
ncbi:MAG: hypothetical protein HFE97_01985 [Oscillospiraceae bacterium]|nr:hypothetical protein [Oscillospiraceae bacterium]